MADEVQATVPRTAKTTEVRRKVISSFKLRGLILKSDASKFLVENLVSLSPGDIGQWLEKIIDSLQEQNLPSTLISKEVVEKIVEECSEREDKDRENIFTFINAHEIPKFKYDVERKRFFKLPDFKPVLFGSAEDKINLYRQRYNILYQRTLHHELFTPVAVAASSAQKVTKFELKPVEHLLSSSGSVENVIVLGMLAQLKEGKYYLEDPTGTVELDLSKSMFHTGIFTETCFVLAEGSFEEKTFHVSALGFPPPEPAKVSRSHFGNLNFFGGQSDSCASASEKLKVIEQENQECMFVFISDLWLDRPKVIAKLKTLLAGYAEMSPALFVFCGNFSSKPEGPTHWDHVKELFSQLGDIIEEFPSLVENSRFVFVPGPQDPGMGTILPRPPIPDIVTEELRGKVPFSIFTTNPCRIQYCTKEIIIYREDIINKMCRNCINLPSTKDGMPNHYVKTIMSQGHLCPLPLHVRPVYWPLDYTLYIYPLPNLIVCADKYSSYNITHLECTCINPGSFARNDFNFKVYWPASHEVEDCKIDS